MISNDLVPLDANIVVSHPLEIVYAQVKIALIVGLIFAFPLIVYEFLMFLKKGMTNHEKRFVICVIPFSMVLFLCGSVFSYAILLKVSTWFLADLGSSLGILNLWSIGKFVSFVFVICVGAGLIFQMPLIVIALSKLGLVDAESMRIWRKHVIVLMFVMSAVITPPDVVTQILLALPLIVLYEFSIFVAKVFR